MQCYRKEKQAQQKKDKENLNLLEMIALHDLETGRKEVNKLVDEIKLSNIFLYNRL